MANADERDMFNERAGGAVEAVAPGGSEPVALEVARVEDYSETPGERFSVFLRGPAAESLTQGTHRLSGDGLGPIDVFLVPVGRDGDRLEYEAAFNRAERL